MEFGKENIIRRKIYLEKIRPHIDYPVIKVISGYRRSGKSYFMQDLMRVIKDADRNTNIIYINKEHYEYDYIIDYHRLQEYFDSRYKKNVKNYFFVDEIQEILSFEKCIRNIFSKKLADIYISGSNADMLSGELATLLSGRYIEIRLRPLSYQEFLDFFDYPASLESFYTYLQQGGMPGLLHINRGIHQGSDYLQGILSTVLLKDVVKRYKIRNVSFLENLIHYLASNIGSLVSSKKISDFLKSQQIKVSINSVLDYLNYICSSYLLTKVNRKDITGKKIFEIGEKYYFEDLGIRNLLVGYNPGDISKLLENVVFNHLAIAGYQVYVGQKTNQEVDFVAERNNEIIYVQVCYLLSDEKVIKREFGNLLDIKDNYKKYVVSMDEHHSRNTYKGIEHYSVPEFCLQLISET
jgi:uncharacterized protein